MYPSLIKLLSILTFLTCCFGDINAQETQSRLKIATVDIQKLFKEYHRTTEEQQKFSKEFTQVQKENNKRLVNIRTLEEQLQRLKKKIEDPTLADNVRLKTSREFQLRFDEAKAMERERREFIDRRTRALELKKRASMQGILEEIRQCIIEYTRSEDFDIVFDKSGLSTNQLPFLIDAKDKINVTASLLLIINEKSSTHSNKSQR